MFLLLPCLSVSLCVCVCVYCGHGTPFVLLGFLIVAHLTCINPAAYCIYPGFLSTNRQIIASASVVDSLQGHLALCVLSSVSMLLFSCVWILSFCVYRSIACCLRSCSSPNLLFHLQLYLLPCLNPCSASFHCMPSLSPDSMINLLCTTTTRVWSPVKLTLASLHLLQ